MKNICRGVALLISGSAAIAGFPKATLVIGAQDIVKFGAPGKQFALPLSFVVTIAVFVIMHIFLTRTALGRKIYSFFGGNAEAARPAGINTDNVQIFCYGMSGFMCGLAGVIYIGRLNSAVPLASLEGDLDAIALPVSSAAHRSSVVRVTFGSLIGAFIIQIIRNGCNLLGVCRPAADRYRRDHHHRCIHRRSSYCNGSKGKETCCCKGKRLIRTSGESSSIWAALLFMRKHRL